MNSSWLKLRSPSCYHKFCVTCELLLVSATFTPIFCCYRGAFLSKLSQGESRTKMIRSNAKGHLSTKGFDDRKHFLLENFLRHKSETSTKIDIDPMVPSTSKSFGSSKIQTFHFWSSHVMLILCVAPQDEGEQSQKFPRNHFQRAKKRRNMLFMFVRLSLLPAQ